MFDKDLFEKAYHIGAYCTNISNDSPCSLYEYSFDENGINFVFCVTFNIHRNEKRNVFLTYEEFSAMEWDDIWKLFGDVEEELVRFYYENRRTKSS